MRLSGRVIRFDKVRGYGFITPDSGGDDVFLHANDLEIEKSSVRPGLRVSFDVDEGERGQFATSVRLCDVASASEFGGPGGCLGNEADEYIDVLSAAEFEHAATELLLTVIPPLSAPQIIAVRAAFAQMAYQQSWLDA